MCKIKSVEGLLSYRPYINIASQYKKCYVFFSKFLIFSTFKKKKQIFSPPSPSVLQLQYMSFPYARGELNPLKGYGDTDRRTVRKTGLNTTVPRSALSLEGGH